MLTRHRLGPNFVHETWCCGIHEDDLENPIIECVALEWALWMSSTTPMLIDGVQCRPSHFYDEAMKYREVKTNWERLEEDCWNDPI